MYEVQKMKLLSNGIGTLTYFGIKLSLTCT
jgi:hypothetical protein